MSVSGLSQQQNQVNVREPRRSSSRGLRSMVAGGLTGAVNILIVFPTEFIKTQLQLDAGRTIFSATHTLLCQNFTRLGTGLGHKTEKLYLGSVDVVKKTVRERGFFGMYRGVQVLLTGTIPTYAVRFGTFDTLKHMVSGGQGSLSPVSRMFCGLGAGVAEATLVVTWIETLKVRLIADQRRKVPKFRGLYHAAITILREEGISGLYRGLGPTIMKQGSNQAIRFFVMESLRNMYTGEDSTAHVPYYMVALFGATAGGASVLGNTPIDVVKTRMQSGRYRSSLECIKHLAKSEGVRGFYKGCLPRLNRVCLEVALAFTIFDTVQDVFKKVWPQT